MPITAVLLFHVFFSNTLLESNRTWMQILAYPFVILALNEILGSYFKLPASIYLFAGLLALLGVFYSYTYPLQAGAGGFVIARLEGDALQNETRIFRERINSTLGRTSHFRGLNIAENFSNGEQAKEFLVNNKNIRILISGNKRWISLFFPERAPRTLKESGLSLPIENIADMKIDYSVKSIGVSYEPSQPTVAFLANLAEGTLRNGDSDNNLIELALLQAGSIEAFWTSFAHRAYPWWMLGNYYLETSLRDSGYSKTLLRCAGYAYGRAGGFLRKGDNPDLRASILNNLALVHTLKGYHLGKKRELHTAVKFFQQAVAANREKSRMPVSFSPALTALENLSQLSVNKKKFIKTNSQSMLLY